ncbi:MAG: hypothetical protein IPK80_28035 [Nannocystis sp.]|nr:hypothetical protein [Nannocystis sp.]
MSATVLIRTIDDFWGLIQASSTTSAWYYFRERISIDTALQYLRDRGLSPDWSSGAEVCEALFRAAQGLTAAKLSRKLKGAIKRNTLAQILKRRRGLGFHVACIWSGGLTVSFDAPELTDKLRARGLEVMSGPSPSPSPSLATRAPAPEPCTEPEPERAPEPSPQLDPPPEPPPPLAPRAPAPELYAEPERRRAPSTELSLVSSLQIAPPWVFSRQLLLIPESCPQVDPSESSHMPSGEALSHDGFVVMYEFRAVTSTNFEVMCKDRACHHVQAAHEPLESNRLEKNCLRPNPPLPHAADVQQSPPVAAPVRLTPDHDRERELAARERELAAREEELQKRKSKLAKRARSVLQREASLAEKEMALATQQAEVAATRTELGREAKFTEMVITVRKAELEREAKSERAEQEREAKSKRAALDQEVTATRAELEREAKATRAELEQQAKAQKTEWEKIEAEKARLAQLDAEIQEKMAQSQKLMKTVAERTRSLMEVPVVNPTLAAILDVVKEATKK